MCVCPCPVCMTRVHAHTCTCGLGVLRVTAAPTHRTKRGKHGKQQEPVNPISRRSGQHRGPSCVFLQVFCGVHAQALGSCRGWLWHGPPPSEGQGSPALSDALLGGSANCLSSGLHSPWAVRATSDPWAWRPLPRAPWWLPSASTRSHVLSTLANSRAFSARRPCPRPPKGAFPRHPGWTWSLSLAGCVICRPWRQSQTRGPCSKAGKGLFLWCFSLSQCCFSCYLT